MSTKEPKSTGAHLPLPLSKGGWTQAFPGQVLVCLPKELGPCFSSCCGSNMTVQVCQQYNTWSLDLIGQVLAGVIQKLQLPSIQRPQVPWDVPVSSAETDMQVGTGAAELGHCIFCCIFLYKYVRVTQRELLESLSDNLCCSPTSSTEHIIITMWVTKLTVQPHCTLANGLCCSSELQVRLMA